MKRRSTIIRAAGAAAAATVNAATSAADVDRHRPKMQHSNHCPARPTPEEQRSKGRGGGNQKGRARRRELSNEPDSARFAAAAIVTASAAVAPRAPECPTTALQHM